jgi:hypothetical protein
MMRVLIPLLMALALPVHATDRPVNGETLLRTTLASPAARLARAQVLEGTFTHRKQLREIPKPLIATGEFTFARELGVYWHTQKPFDSVMLLTPNGIRERTGKTETLSLSADEQPAVRVVAEVFLALFTLDMTRLERNFALTTSVEGTAAGRWTIGLEPRAAAITNLFVHATITGAADVEQVVLTDTHGDQTVIDLEAIRYSNAPPSAATRALFAPAKP